MIGNLKPPFSYHGGKQRLASKLVRLIPKHTVYVEPFCGGATLMFRKPWPAITSAHYYREIINDTNEDVMNFFRCLRDNGEELCGKLELTQYSESEHRWAKNIDCESNIERAVQFFVNVQQSFGNVLRGGWGRGVYGRDLAFSWRNCKNLFEYVERMNGVHITCQDAMTVIKQWDSPQTFFYLDPPYPKTDQGRYRGYSVADFNNLVDVVKDCKGSAMLSCYASDEFEIPSDWDRFDFVARCSVSSKGCVGVDRSSDSDRKDLGNTKRIETVYRKGSSVKPRREIQKQYDKGAFDCFQDVGFSRKNCLQDSLFK